MIELSVDKTESLFGKKLDNIGIFQVSKYQCVSSFIKGQHVSRIKSIDVLQVPEVSLYFSIKSINTF